MILILCHCGSRVHGSLDPDVIEYHFPFRWSPVASNGFIVYRMNMSAMSTPYKRASENLSAITSLLVLGGGFLALFAGINSFWIIWVLGFCVLVPLVSILFGEEGTTDELSMAADSNTTETRPTKANADRETTNSETTTQDALDTLRERYARGDLTEKQFERKLTRLLETETPEQAMEWHEQNRDRETETEF